MPYRVRVLGVEVVAGTAREAFELARMAAHASSKPADHERTERGPDGLDRGGRVYPESRALPRRRGEPPPTCDDAEGCDRPAWTLGKCPKHYRRVEKARRAARVKGTGLESAPPRAEDAPGTPLPAPTPEPPAEAPETPKDGFGDPGTALLAFICSGMPAGAAAEVVERSPNPGLDFAVPMADIFATKTDIVAKLAAGFRGSRACKKCGQSGHYAKTCGRPKPVARPPHVPKKRTDGRINVGHGYTLGKEASAEYTTRVRVCGGCLLEGEKPLCKSTQPSLTPCAACGKPCELGWFVQRKGAA